MNHTKLFKQAGFTIVELLIVIVVIAILAAISIVAFNGAIQRANTSAIAAKEDQAKKKLEIYKVDNGAYPPDQATFDSLINQTPSDKFYTTYSSLSPYSEYTLSTNASATPPSGHVPTTSVTGSAWTRNDISSMTGNEVTLINNEGNKSSSVVSNSTFSGWDGKTLSADVSLAGSADILTIGILDAAMPATTGTSPMLHQSPGFYGVYLNLFATKQIVVFSNGSFQGGFNYDPTTSGYETYKVKYIDDGTTLTIQVYRGNTLVTSWSNLNKPSFTNFRIAIGARTGGLTGVFKVQGTPQTD
jgi:prepilin-type N-terminal cleavage/methylation domain-containing protein